jgi:hypothetical protein
MDSCIIPECYVDTNLIETLVPPSKKYNHQKGCGTVAKIMKEKFQDRFALGIIDKDKQIIDYVKEFDTIETKGNLSLLKHKSKPHFFIIVSPAIEKFIMNNALSSGLSLSDFALPNDLDELKKVSKTVNSKNNINFKNLFKKLISSHNDEFMTMKSWIEYLKHNPYYNKYSQTKSK